MKHTGTQTIETDRLVLRRFTVEDAEAMYRNWACDPEITRFLRWAPHANAEVTRGLLEEWVENYRKQDYYHWAIEVKEDHALIGSIGILDVSELDECGEIGYCISKRWWGKGIMTEAVKALIAFAFQKIGLHRLEAYHSVNNPASGRVMQKAGMIFEGTARQKYKCRDGFQDSNFYAILNEKA